MLQVLTTTPGTADAADPAARVREDVVSVRGLVKAYGDGPPAVRGIDLTVGRGEVLGLLGPNGAGKTSTVEVLTGFRRASAGEVRVLGLDPGDPRDLRELRRRVGVVLQQTGHYRYLSARETVAMHRAYHEHPRGVEEVLELVGLREHADGRVRELSGGQQRRLDVAVALVGRPELIFLDEPTTGFDPAARRRAWDLIAGLTQLGTTVVLTTHYMEEAQVLADRLVVMRAGEVVATGTPAEIASGLELGTRISFRLPAEVAVRDLPAGDWTTTEQPGEVTMSTDEPTRVLAEVCGWAAARGVELAALAAEPATLEDAYLRLTEGSP